MDSSLGTRTAKACARVLHTDIADYRNRAIAELATSLFSMAQTVDALKRVVALGALNACASTDELVVFAERLSGRSIAPCKASR